MPFDSQYAHYKLKELYGTCMASQLHIQLLLLLTQLAGESVGESAGCPRPALLSSYSRHLYIHRI